ncbi:MAG: cysteinyl-tRNA synthetase [Myxococcota bacterium]
MAAPFRLYNSLTRSLEDFEPLTPDHVGLYVCGMTVYDRCHVGHARAMVVFDSFVRYLRHQDWNVTFVRNFTDVDDKIIARAAQNGEEPLALAARFIDLFHEDMRAMGLLMPDHEPKVSDSIDDIITMAKTLVDKGNAYEIDGSVWYSVKSFDEYGKLSGQRVDELRSADAGDKRHPADFALWKAAKPGEPSWESPWGQGRPGWHIECSAMAGTTLGKTLDIHGGGLDLVFPHHENEIAQSEACNGQHYSRYWMHNGLLTMASGQKMGKSLGNVIDIQHALAGFPADALRVYYLQNHYRSPLPWSEEALPEALTMVARLYETRELLESMGGVERADPVAQDLGSDALDVLNLSQRFEARFFKALAEDFNTSQALGHLFELSRAINRMANHKKAKTRGGPIAALALKAFDIAHEALGLFVLEPQAFFEEVKNKRLAASGIATADVDALVAARSQARADKEWARADSLRNELDAKGIDVRDGADGVTWRVRV